VRHIIITGFMGTGKTTVGRDVARRLDRPFIDMDAEIEVRALKPVSRIFAEDGEAAFRQMEAALCAELCAQPAAVIATGGGTLIDPTNRERMLSSGTVVCLTGAVDELLQRLREVGNPDRPLLNVSHPRTRMLQLLEARREAYAAIPWQIDTTGRAVAEIAAQIIHIANAVTLPVRHPGGRYDIHIGDGMLAHVGSALLAGGAAAGSVVAIVSTPVVAPLYAASVEDSAASAGLRPLLCSIPDGESYKTLQTVAGLYQRFLTAGLDRSSAVLSMGGGVTGDIAGFAAATYMRGVRFAQLPTTLLAMVDASVGGKTGVDLAQGKNLVGAFKQPAWVIIDPTVLTTLPLEELRCGLAELLKHAVIGDPALFAQLEAQVGEPLNWAQGELAPWIARSLRVKIDIVEQDPFERGRRAVLNFGHTVGHALERLSGFELRHGQAISVGMVAAAKIAAQLGWADPALAGRLEAVLSSWGLPVRCPPFEAEQICQALAFDKKKRGPELRWILPRAIGQVEIADSVPPEVVKAVLQGMGAGGRP